jgi:hypothetical protein
VFFTKKLEGMLNGQNTKTPHVMRINLIIVKPMKVMEDIVLGKRQIKYLLLFINILFNYQVIHSKDLMQNISTSIEYHKLDNSGENGVIHITVFSNVNIMDSKIEIISPDFVHLDQTNPIWHGIISKGKLLEFVTEIRISEFSDFKIKAVISGHSENCGKINLTSYMFFLWNNNEFQTTTSNKDERNSRPEMLFKLIPKGQNPFNCLTSRSTLKNDFSETLSADSIIIKGSVQYADSSNSLQPLMYGLVELLSKEPSGLKILHRTSTDYSGKYKIEIVQDSSLYGQDAYVRISTKGMAGYPEGSTGMVEVLDEIFKEPYFAVSDPFTIRSDLSGALNLDIIINESVDWGACSVFEHIVHGWLLTKEELGINLEKVVALWPSSYSTYSDTIRVLQSDRWDRDVVLHEYGHFVDQQYHITKTPGGDHFFDENLSNRYDEETAKKLAWGEAWADFFSVGIQYAETKDSYYDDTEDINMHVNLDGPIKHPGTDCEAAVAAILWDIFDEANEPFDSLSLGIQPIWKLVSISGPISDIDHLITLWTQHDLGYLDEINAIYSEYTRNAPVFVDTYRPTLPEDLALENYPNPFNSETTIQYTISKDGWVHLGIYDILGRKIKTLVNEKQEAMKSHTTKWYGRNENSLPATSGIYYAVLQVNDKRCVRKLLLIK